MLSVACWDDAIDNTSQEATRIADSVESGKTQVAVGIREIQQLVAGKVPELERAAAELANTTASALGTQTRCSIEEVRAAFANSIRELWRKKKGTSTPTVCVSDPLVLATSDVMSGSRMHIAFTGFDLPRDLRAKLFDSAGKQLYDATSDVTWVSAFVAVVRFSPAMLPAIFDPTAKELQLSSANGKVLGAAAISNTPLPCKDKSDQPVAAPTVTLKPNKVYFGDADFSGHGPWVHWGAIVFIDPNTHRNLRVSVHFDAQEVRQITSEQIKSLLSNAGVTGFTRQFWETALKIAESNGGAWYVREGDGTTMIADQIFLLWTAPEGYEIRSINLPPFLSVPGMPEGAAYGINGQYFDTNTQNDIFQPGPPIQTVEIVGDTSGDDLGRTGITITWDAISVHLHQVQNCTETQPASLSALTGVMPHVRSSEEPNHFTSPADHLTVPLPPAGPDIP